MGKPPHNPDMALARPDATRRDGEQPVSCEQVADDVPTAPTRNTARLPRAAHATPQRATLAVVDEVHAQDGAPRRVAAVFRSGTTVRRFIVVATGRLRRRYPVSCVRCDHTDGRACGERTQSASGTP